MTPESIRAAIAEGSRHHQAGRLAEARQLYERVLVVDPSQPDALNLLGMIDYAAGDRALAVGRIEQAIRINPRVPGFYTNLGVILQASGDVHSAARAFRQALQIKPDHLAALYNLGTALQALAEFEAAAHAYGTALRINPRQRDAWNNLGNCQAKVGHAQAALQSFGKAIQLDPGFLAARVNAAGLLLTLGRFAEAERVCRDVVRQDPLQAEAWNNLGLALMKLNRTDEAAAAYRAALDVRSDYDDAALNLGNALFELGQQAEAIALFTTIIARSPDHGASRLARSVASIPIMPVSTEPGEAVVRDFEQATAELEDWAVAHPGALARVAGIAQPFLLAYRPQDITAPLARFGTLICREVAQGASPPALAVPAGGARARARIGIVSGHVRSHPVWQVILRGILEGLDRDRFDVRLYETGHLRDEETDWAERNVDHYQREPQSISAWIDHIGREAPDIIFYPEVGMDPVAGALATHRLAKLQVASWGHPVTTGLPSMDAYLSGEAIEPPDAGAHYTERLIRLPGTGVLTRFGSPSVRRWSGPARPPGHVRFALCQQPMKFDPKDDALVARIAKEAGPSEFWIVKSSKHPWASDRLMRRLSKAFEAAGLDPSRYLRLTGWMDQAEFSGFLDEMDVMLDCPAFSGYTTAWQAIHRGTPIVTLEGPFMRQRLAAGLLRQIGRPEGVAHTAEHYVGLAVDHGQRSRREPAALRRGVAAAASRADGNVDAIAALQHFLLTS